MTVNESKKLVDSILNATLLLVQAIRMYEKLQGIPNTPENKALIDAADDYVTQALSGLEDASVITMKK